MGKTIHVIVGAMLKSNKPHHFCALDTMTCLIRFNRYRTTLICELSGIFMQQFGMGSPAYSLEEEVQAMESNRNDSRKI